jgi:hypothetical protein
MKNKKAVERMLELQKNNETKKEISFEVKVIGEDDERILRFISSTETPDRDEDIIRVAGWNLENFKKNPVILFMHNNFMPPIAKAISVTKDLIAKQLVIDMKFPTISELSSDVENPHQHALFADMIFNMAKNGYIGTGSVGFRSNLFQRRLDQDDMPEWSRGIEFIEQELLEFSITTVPANPEAVIMRSMKSKGLATHDQIDQFAKYAKTFIDLGNITPEEGRDFHWVEEEEGNKLADAAELEAKNLGIEIHRTVVDGKEHTVSVLDIEDKGINASFEYFTDKSGSLTIDSKYLSQEGTKTADPFGNPSARDIEFSIDDSLFDTLNERRTGWSIDVYPINYPSGNVTIHHFGDDTIKLHAYIYEKGENGVVITLGEGREVEVALDFKSISEQKSAVVKTGATISQKNRNSINSAIDKMNEGIEGLKAVLTAAQEEVEPPIVEPEDKSNKSDEVEIVKINDIQEDDEFIIFDN